MLNQIGGPGANGSTPTTGPATKCSHSPVMGRRRVRNKPERRVRNKGSGCPFGGPDAGTAPLDVPVFGQAQTLNHCQAGSGVAKPDSTDTALKGLLP